MDQPENYDVSVLRAQLTAHLGADAGYYPKRIEAQYPRILAKIVELWGSATLDDYLNELMLPSRPGRQGFPPDIAMEIFHLVNIHSSLQLSAKPTGTGWSGIEDPEQFKKALSKDG